MVGTSFSSFPNAPGAPSGQRGTGSPISACIETEKATSAAGSKLVFMVIVVGYIVSAAELNERPVRFKMAKGIGRRACPSTPSRVPTPRYAIKMRHSPGQCINRPHNRTGMAQVETLARTSTRRVTFRIDEVLNRFMRAGATNDFRAKIIGTTRCSRRIYADVSLLDFHTDKFQLRGIDLPNRASLARAPAANF